MAFIDLVQARRTVRRYTGETIPAEKLEKVLQAALMAPTARNMRPWEFIVVRDKDVLTKLGDSRLGGAAKTLAWADAAVVVIGAESSDTWPEDCSIAMAFMQLMAEDQGLGSCWIQGRLRDAAEGVSTEAYVRDLLGYPEDMHLEAILSLGVPAKHPEAHDVDALPMEKIHNEKY